MVADATNETKPLLWRVLDEAHTRAGSILVEVKHFADDEAYPDTEYATSICSVDHDIDWHNDPADHIHVLIGPELHALTGQELAEDIIRWICDAGTKFCADRMSGPQSTCLGNDTWALARIIIAELEAEIAAKRGECAA